MTKAISIPRQFANHAKRQWFSGFEKLALATGTLAAGATLAVLLSQPLVTGNWSLKHALVPVLIILTITAGKLALAAFRRLSTIALGVVFGAAFIGGTALIVLNSVGSQAELYQAKTAAVRAINQQRADLVSERERTRQRLAHAEKEFGDQMNGNKARGIKRCRHADIKRRCPTAYGWKLAMQERQSRIDALSGEIAALGARESLDPKAEQWGRMMAVFGADPEKVETAIVLWEMPLWALIFELVSVAAFFFAFGTLSHSAARPLPARALPAPLTALPARPYSKADAERDLLDRLAAGDSPRQADLAQRWQRSITWVSRLTRDLQHAGTIKRERNGKWMMLML